MIKKIVLAIVGIVLLAAVVIGARYLLAYNGFIDKITSREPEMKKYDVIVLEDSEAKDVFDLADKNVGFLKTDTKAANAGQ